MEKGGRGSVPRGYQTARERCRVSVIDATPGDKQTTSGGGAASSGSDWTAEETTLAYGARDTIVREVSGGDVACSLRIVDALPTFDGRPRDWTPQFDVRGMVIERKRLVGIASVEFPPVTPEMRASGIWTSEACPYGEQRLGVRGRDDRIHMLQLPGRRYQRP